MMCNCCVGSHPWKICSQYQLFLTILPEQSHLGKKLLIQYKHYVLIIQGLFINHCQKQMHGYERGMGHSWDKLDQTGWFVVILAAIPNIDIWIGYLRNAGRKGGNNLPSILWLTKWMDEMDVCHIAWLAKEFI